MLFDKYDKCNSCTYYIDEACNNKYVKSLTVTVDGKEYTDINELRQIHNEYVPDMISDGKIYTYRVKRGDGYDSLALYEDVHNPSCFIIMAHNLAFESKYKVGKEVVINIDNKRFKMASSLLRDKANTAYNLWIISIMFNICEDEEEMRICLKNKQLLEYYQI